MNKFLTIACTVLSLACIALAWQWIVTFDPSNPIVPLGLCALGGFTFRQAFA